MKGKKKLKIKYGNIIITLFVIVCLVFMCISLYHIIVWKIDGDSTIKQIEELDNQVKVQEVVEVNNENVEIIEHEAKPSESDPYWDFIKTSLISVDFSDLKEANNETVGWIQVNGTNINYPFVQTGNNEYYLTHSFNKSNNSAGWVFLDYRNDKNLSDKNNILYAHGRIENTMFGSLRNALSNGWLNNKDNYVFKVSTPSTNTMWQVFSVYKIEPTTDYIQVFFGNDNEYEQFINKLIDRSAHNFDTGISKDDTIITLSTCYDDNYRMVLHAKLIKKENR